MSATSATLTVRLRPEVKEQLGELAERTRRTRSFLGGEAIAAYVARELDIIEGVQRGLEDMRAGRVVPHDEAMRQIRATIAKAAKERPPR
jgi:predicted transcriptional regulator